MRDFKEIKLEEISRPSGLTEFHFAINSKIDTITDLKQLIEIKKNEVIKKGYKIIDQEVFDNIYDFGKRVTFLCKKL